MDFVLDNMKPGDWDQVCRVYGEGIATGHATFEAGPAAWEQWVPDTCRGRVWWPGPATLFWDGLP